MSRVYKYDGSKALIKKTDDGYVAECRCGWISDTKDSREKAIIDFETHVSSDPKHRIIREGYGPNLISLILAAIGIIYVISPFDLVPDILVVVGWLEDIIILIFSIIFIKKGLEGESPGDILSSIFS